MSAINLDQTQSDISMSDAAILKALKMADGSEKISTHTEIKKPIDDHLSTHMFLEDLRFLGKHQREKLSSFKTCLRDLLSLFEEVKSKMMEMGSIFSEIQTSHIELEENSRPEITKIKPQLSSVYAELKTSFYSWANIFQHQHKHVKKLFEPCLLTLEKGNMNNLKNMGVRSQLIKKYMSSVKANQHLKKGFQDQPQGEGDDPDSNRKDPQVILEVERKKRLDKVNKAIFKDYIKQYKEEQETMMRVGINVAAYQINVLDKVSLFTMLFNFFRRRICGRRYCKELRHLPQKINFC